MAQQLQPDDTMQPLLRTASHDESEMDITPMIDITFLLLIFFIVSSKMDSSADVKLPKANYGTAVVEKSSVVITIVADEDGSAIVYRGDGIVPANQVPSGDMEAQEAEVTAYVEEEMTGGSKEYVLIKADQGLKQREMSRIAKAATRPEAVQQLFVAVLEVQ